jgi:hypothetical protein
MSDKATNPNRGIQASDFLNPASMLTPGLAGAVAMMITNALSSAFDFNPPYTALGLSFLLGTIVWVSDVRFVARCVYYLLNSLIIFSVAFGTNTIGERSGSRSTSVTFQITTSAYGAEEVHPQTPIVSPARDPALSAQIQELINTAIQKAAESGNRNDPAVVAQKDRILELLKAPIKAPTPIVAAPKPPAAPKTAKAQTGFFRPWNF